MLDLKTRRAGQKRPRDPRAATAGAPGGADFVRRDRPLDGRSDRARVLRQRQLLRAVRRLPRRGDVRHPPRILGPARPEHRRRSTPFRLPRARNGKSASAAAISNGGESDGRPLCSAADRALVHGRRRSPRSLFMLLGCAVYRDARLDRSGNAAARPARDVRSASRSGLRRQWESPVGRRGGRGHAAAAAEGGGAIDARFHGCRGRSGSPACCRAAAEGRLEHRTTSRVSVVVVALSWTIFWFARHSRQRGWLR